MSNRPPKLWKPRRALNFIFLPCKLWISFHFNQKTCNPWIFQVFKIYQNLDMCYFTSHEFQTHPDGIDDLSNVQNCYYFFQLAISKVLIGQHLQTFSLWKTINSIINNKVLMDNYKVLMDLFQPSYDLVITCWHRNRGHQIWT